MNKIVLVISAHTDDEALGCAGTIAKHIKEGDKVHLLFMTDGVSARKASTIEKNKRITNAKKVSKILKVSSFTNLNFPDNQMDTIPLLQIVKKIENKIFKIQPDIIYTHHIGDLNIDHQKTHKAVITACRPQPNFCVKEIYTFEVLSSTEWMTPHVSTFVPNVFINISKYINLKEKVLNIYSEEMREPPHTRSIENIIRLNKLRGSSVGVEYAEAFQLVRMCK